MNGFEHEYRQSLDDYQLLTQMTLNASYMHVLYTCNNVPIDLITVDRTKEILEPRNEGVYNRR